MTEAGVIGLASFFWILGFVFGARGRLGWLYVSTIKRLETLRLKRAGSKDGR